MEERDHVEDLRRRWENNIKTGWEGVDWICLVQERDKWRALTSTGELKYMRV
jgi:hypothetical protein